MFSIFEQSSNNPKSTKKMLKCKSASHSSSNCPQSGPKVGASLNPEKILAQPPNVTQAAQKGPEVSKGVSGILGVSLADRSIPPPTVPPVDTGSVMHQSITPPNKHPLSFSLAGSLQKKQPKAPSTNPYKCRIC